MVSKQITSAAKKFIAGLSIKDKAKIKKLAKANVKQADIGKIFVTKKENIGFYLRSDKLGKRRPPTKYERYVAIKLESLQKMAKEGLIVDDGKLPTRARKETNAMPEIKAKRDERTKAHLRQIIRKRKRTGYQGYNKAEKKRWDAYNKGAEAVKKRLGLTDEEFDTMVDSKDDVSVTG